MPEINEGRRIPPRHTRRIKLYYNMMYYNVVEYHVVIVSVSVPPKRELTHRNHMRVQNPLILGADLVNFHLDAVAVAVAAVTILIPPRTVVQVEVGQRRLAPPFSSLSLVGHVLQLEAVPCRTGHDEYLSRDG